MVDMSEYCDVLQARSDDLNQNLVLEGIRKQTRLTRVFSMGTANVLTDDIMQEKSRCCFDRVGGEGIGWPVRFPKRSGLL